MKIEKFGYNEKAFTDEEWFEIAKDLKNSPFIRARNLRMIYEAEHQGSRFNRIGLASGLFFFVALLKFPVIRVQPGFRRLGLSAAISYPIYSYVSSIGDEMKVKRIKTAYRKTLVEHQGHHRITM